MTTPPPHAADATGAPARGRRRRRLTALRSGGVLAVGCLLALGLSACGGSGFSSSSTSAPPATSSATPTDKPLTVLIASSGDAETTAVKSAVQAWSQQSGIKATVIPAANLDQQAAQGFAAGKPADIIYTSTADLNSWAKAGNLLPYGDILPNKSDYYPSLVQAFTYDNKFYCAPKDFSTLQLVINTKMWKEAGLTDADYPKTWDDLASVAKKLTKGKRVGLTMSPQIERLGVFLAENGGGLTSPDGKTATVNSEANVKALDYVKTLLASGSTKFSSDLGAGWGGEAFGKGLAAMTIEGNWITGAMSSDYPKIDYEVVPLPKGTQAGTLQFTNCWGITAKSQNIGGAESLVEYLTTTQQQLQFAKAFGVMPSLQSAKDQWIQQNPKMKAFIDGADYAQNLPSQVGTAEVISDLDSKIPSLKKASPKSILDPVQSELQAALSGS